MTKRAVTVIPATKNMFTALPTTSIQKRRVAAYARVSTDSDEQFTSYEAQIDYYTQYIKKREDWQFVKVYTDEGISGTNTKHREGFNQMVADALAGKIDLIITKSVTLDDEMPHHRIELIFQTLGEGALICDETTQSIASELNYKGKIYRYDELASGEADDAVLADIRDKQLDIDPIYIVFTSTT